MFKKTCLCFSLCNLIRQRLRTSKALGTDHHKMLQGALFEFNTLPMDVSLISISLYDDTINNIIERIALCIQSTIH